MSIFYLLVLFQPVFVFLFSIGLECQEDNQFVNGWCGSNDLTVTLAKDDMNWSILLVLVDTFEREKYLKRGLDNDLVLKKGTDL